MAVWRFIDDIGPAVLEYPQQEGFGPTARPVLHDTRHGVARKLKDEGLGIHKEAYGPAVDSLGFALNAEPPLVRVMDEKYWLAVESAIFLSGCERVLAECV